MVVLAAVVLAERRPLTGRLLPVVRLGSLVLGLLLLVLGLLLLVLGLLVLGLLRPARGLLLRPSRLRRLLLLRVGLLSVRLLLLVVRLLAVGGLGTVLVERRLPRLRSRGLLGRGGTPRGVGPASATAL
ncbi:hypothetical protein [Spirillospora sp. NPDC047279]|uniref:hypothetical protein n=1 Tax=Spirillospora sp. NPDC047279 TaxID=3155478 RepID=UPI0033E9FD29